MKNYFLKFILLYLILFNFYNFILLYKKVNSIDLILSNMIFNVIYSFVFFFLIFKTINNKNKKFFIINCLWFILIFLFNKNSFEINNNQNLNINNFYWLILYLIDRIYFGFLLVIIWCFFVFLRVNFIFKKTNEFILNNNNKMKLFLISFLSPFKIFFVFKKICSYLIIKSKLLQIRNIMLIVFRKKTEQLIKLKIAYFPPRHYKLKNTLIN